MSRISVDKNQPSFRMVQSEKFAIQREDADPIRGAHGG